MNPQKKKTQTQTNKKKKKHHQKKTTTTHQHAKVIVMIWAQTVARTCSDKLTRGESQCGKGKRIYVPRQRESILKSGRGNGDKQKRPVTSVAGVKPRQPGWGRGPHTVNSQGRKK